MAYLTYAEYVAISMDPVEEADFDKLIKAATVKMDIMTNYFYDCVDFDTDFPKRKEAFQVATAYLIDFYAFSGSAYSFERNKPLNITIGRTQQSIGDTNQKGVNSDIPLEVIQLLDRWGFRFKGVGTYQG